MSFYRLLFKRKQAKSQLNFSEFGSYSQRRQLSKLDGIANSLKDSIMPLKSYKIMHKYAQLSKDEKLLLINWAQHSLDSHGHNPYMGMEGHNLLKVNN